MTFQQCDDLHGQIIDLDVFFNDAWLQDSAVIEHIRQRDGNWEIALVFAYVWFPLKFIRRKITTYFTEQKANINASYMRRLAAKDQRGTLSVDRKHFKHCLN